jgi:hypothetical protein
VRAGWQKLKGNQLVDGIVAGTRQLRKRPDPEGVNTMICQKHANAANGLPGKTRRFTEPARSASADGSAGLALPTVIWMPPLP